MVLFLFSIASCRASLWTASGFFEAVRFGKICLRCACTGCLEEIGASIALEKRALLVRLRDTDLHHQAPKGSILTPEGGPMCFSDTKRGPFVFFWHYKGALCGFLTLERALCAFLTLEKGPMCFSGTRRRPCVLFWLYVLFWQQNSFLLYSEKNIGPPSRVNMDPFGAWWQAQKSINHGIWNFDV